MDHVYIRQGEREMRKGERKVKELEIGTSVITEQEEAELW